MNYNLIKIFSVLLLLAILSCRSDDKGGGGSDGGEGTLPSPENVTKTNSMKLYMHYMPWFETKESNNGSWGYHWTMHTRNPDKILSNGQREIASYYYPLIGPYHSGDQDVIENHLLLMKYAGVDGILINWYGTFNLNDFPVNKQNSEQIISMLSKVGMKYAIVYEDRFLNDIVNAGLAITASTAARDDFNYVQTHYFSDPNYIKNNEKPLLLNFGPIVLKTEEEWTKAFSLLNTKPEFYTLWYDSGSAGNNASGEFAWVYQDNSHLANFYNIRANQIPKAIAGAYPGFKDYYAEGGEGSGLGWTIPHNNGATLDETLSLAKNSGLNQLQLITWNDFGEGTMIEPTVEFGYSYVKKLKNFAGVQNTGDVFEDIGKLFTLRKKYAGNAQIQDKLNSARAYFAAVQPDKAKSILNEIQ